MLDESQSMNRSGNKTSEKIAARARVRRCTGVAAAVAFAIASVAPLAADALPVIPGVHSFGTSTPAGRGGKVYRVTNLNTSGAGSLYACVAASGPRVCVFEVSGTINMGRDLIIKNPNITIAGQTAPSPGIMLRGGAIWVQTSDVLVQHLHVRVGDDPGGSIPDNRDALKIDTGGAKISNVVIDHCSFSWAIDETASVWKNWDNVSLLSNIFSEPLNDSLHSKGPHGYGVILGPVGGKVAMIGNLMAHTVSRNPLTYAPKAVIVNNVVYNWANMAVDLAGDGEQTFSTVVGNVFVRGPDYNKNPPVVLRASGALVPVGSKLYLADNVAAEATSDPWSIAGSFGGVLNLSGFKAADPMVWPAGMVRMGTSEDSTLKHVLKHVGARPADRDVVDTRLIKEVQTHTGHIVNCVAPNGTARCERNAGGWPKMAENHRALDLPANPNAVGPSGYTNLEVFLQKMAADVEGRSDRPPEAPVLKE